MAPPNESPIENPLPDAHVNDAPPVDENTGDQPQDQPSRREFIQSAVVPLTVGNMGGASAKAQENESLYQPQEVWEERMEAPDDGKKFGWFIDTRRCFGCHGCEVSC